MIELVAAALLGFMMGWLTCVVIADRLDGDE